MGRSKKYKDKLCVYCRFNISTEADHVFPREIFQPNQRAMLPKVPACRECNNKKSKLEHYLLSVLPFGATHSNAQKALSVDAAKRLAKNKKLHRKLKNEFGYKFIPNKDGGKDQRLVIGFDHDILYRFIGFVGKGLIWYHWEKYLPIECTYKAFAPSVIGLEFLNSLFNLSTNYRISNQLGDGTVRYKGVMSETDEDLSVWTIQLLGGMSVLNKKTNYVFNNSFIAMITGSQKTLESIDVQ